MGDWLNGNTSAPEHPLLERWNGSTWTILSVPLPSGAAGGQLRSISCTSPTNCFIAGAWRASNLHYHVLLLRGHATTWAVQSAADPAGSSEPTLSGVACMSATNCSAVGGDSSPGHAIAERWNGSTWSVVSTPNPGSLDYLNSVSCTAVGCTAVGDYSSASSGLALALHWNGTSWAQQSAANPTTINLLNGVSCASATALCRGRRGKQRRADRGVERQLVGCADTREHPDVILGLAGGGVVHIDDELRRRRVFAVHVPRQRRRRADPHRTVRLSEWAGVGDGGVAVRWSRPHSRSR